jgi:Ca2+-binding RTX toxin-like protein
MATYDLNRGELNALMASDHVDPSARKAVIDYLMYDGDVGRNSRVDVQVGGGSLDPNAQVLVLDGTSDPNVTLDANLKVIVDVNNAPLTMTGSGDPLVVMGSGNNTISGSGSSDSHTFMTGGADDEFDWSSGGGGFNTLAGGLGIEDDGSKAQGAGNDSLVGGSGDDLFIVGKSGNDTITGGGGNDTVMFDDGSANANITQNGVTTTVQFGDTGQTITINGVDHLVFTDTDHH